MWYDAFVSQQMSEHHSFRPEGWLFGNQFYIIATPSLAAIIYMLTKNTILAMSIASCIMMVFVILSLLYLLKSLHVSNIGKIAAILLMIGGCILGTSATKYTEGFQILYTMCSYYASYLTVSFLCLGIYTRLHEKESVNLGLLILSCLLVFGIGMNSLRELAVLILPLICLEVIDFCFIKRKPRSFSSSLIYVLLLLVLNLAGHFIWESFHVPQQKIIGGIIPVSSISMFIVRIFETLKQFLHITGVLLVRNGLENIPLSLLSICFIGITLLSIYTIIKKRDTSALARIILFFCISLSGIIAIGVLIMSVRSIYFFMYYPLVVFSTIYQMENTIDKPKIIRLQSFTILASLICYFYNFIPDFIEYKRYNNESQLFSEKIVQTGVKTIYFHTHTSPIVVQYAKGKVEKGDFWFNTHSDELFLVPVEYLNSKYIFNKAHKNQALICLSNESIASLQKNCSPNYVEAFFSHLEYFDSITNSLGTFTLFKPKSPLPLFYPDVI